LRQTNARRIPCFKKLPQDTAELFAQLPHTELNNRLHNVLVIISLIDRLVLKNWRD